MKRRLFFLLPDIAHTHAVIKELLASGIRRDALHVVAKPGLDTRHLPVTVYPRLGDSAGRLETILWDGNLLVFLLALLAGIAMFLLQLHWSWLLLPAAVMLISSAAGVLFTAHVPSVQLSGFADAIHHGELLLTIDVPLRHVSWVESLVHRHHPEAVAGGVSWHIDFLHA